MQTESIVSTVIPHLFVRRPPVRAPRSASGVRAADLARLLIAPDLDEAFERIDQARTHAASPAALFTDLFEPTARKLGDLWSDDFCSEFEVSIGLCHLQTAIRRISFDHLSVPLPPAQPRSALLVSQPGEPHSFCATLNSEMLRQAGWNVACEFPATDRALQDLVANASYDALNLSLSPALRREHWAPRMAETIRLARRASRNPALAVVVSGRLFSERPEACEQVGADGSNISGQQVARCINRALLKRITRMPANFAWI
ncbi:MULTISPECIES: cobalamin B12-binding domain-containing protein [Rhodopseudomonas]|uniref:cobalamin B12-binding domain-containing protein n=1 Tax=Rhodopseudomonas TaxID=1073 RepID=UPI001F2547FE|nr:MULTISPECIES: cobalamin B12-binding domain-containing protein [Rhodopseudomonas]MDF3809110.1 cobalamin B12-binding domain-containing protein [Rhodopseudomonas sp. BAL398]WOK16429.1 cobalamin B12-binding domain-containing protein [Rhodopseudomonas sp. BAL398]